MKIEVIDRGNGFYEPYNGNSQDTIAVRINGNSVERKTNSGSWVTVKNLGEPVIELFWLKTAGGKIYAYTESKKFTYCCAFSPDPGKRYNTQRIEISTRDENEKETKNKKKINNQEEFSSGKKGLGILGSFSKSSDTPSKKELRAAQKKLEEEKREKWKAEKALYEAEMAAEEAEIVNGERIVLESFGYGFKNFSYEKKVESILSLYLSTKLTELQTVELLQSAIDITSYSVDQFVSNLSNNSENQDIKVLANKFISIFKDQIEFNERDKNLFQGLASTFEKDDDKEDYSVETKGFFDFDNKSRNKKVEKFLLKRSSLRRSIDSNKKSLRERLKSILYRMEERAIKEKELEELRNKKPTKKGFFSRINEKMEKSKEKDNIKSEISSLEHKISSDRYDLKSYFYDLNHNIDEYNEVNKELHHLTSSPKFHGNYCENGEEIELIRTISKVNSSTYTKAAKTILELIKPYMNPELVN